MDNKFEVIFISKSDSENLMIEINFNGQILCQLNKDKGINNIEIEFFSDAIILSKEVRMIFPLDEFLSLLEEVKQDLINC